MRKNGLIKIFGENKFSIYWVTNLDRIWEMYRSGTRTVNIGEFWMVALDSQPPTDQERCCSGWIHDLHLVEPETRPGSKNIRCWFCTQYQIEIGLVGRLRCSGSCCRVERGMLLHSPLGVVRSSLNKVVPRRGWRVGAMRDWGGAGWRQAWVGSCRGFLFNHESVLSVVWSVLGLRDVCRFHIYSCTHNAWCFNRQVRRSHCYQRMWARP